MVEMLGVLAIIGVLSIGGLAAYRTAMERYRINQFLNSIGLLKLVALECLQADNCSSLGKNYIESSHSICTAIGNPADFCGEVKSGMTYTSLYNPVQKTNAYWYVAYYPQEKSFFIFLKNLSPNACMALVNNIGSVKVVIGGKSTTSPEVAKEYCKTNLNDYDALVYFVWTIEDF